MRRLFGFKRKMDELFSRILHEDGKGGKIDLDTDENSRFVRTRSREHLGGRWVGHVDPRPVEHVYSVFCF